MRVRLPRMTIQRWMLLIALLAIVLVAAQTVDLLVRDARQKAADERWANPWLRAGDEYEERWR